jgi:osmotically-inducible protein OsmY
MTKKQKIQGELRFLLFALLAVGIVAFLCHTTSFAAEEIKESAKETKKEISEDTKEVVKEIKKDKNVVVEDVKEGWISVKKSSKSTYSAVTEGLTEAAIVTKVKTKLLVNKNMEAFKDIEVSAEKQVIILKGKVPSWKHAAEAVKIALNTSGVKKVIANLDITHSQNNEKK